MQLRRQKDETKNPKSDKVIIIQGNMKRTEEIIIFSILLMDF